MQRLIDRLHLSGEWDFNIDISAPLIARPSLG
jgi:hypothetical protein